MISKLLGCFYKEGIYGKSFSLLTKYEMTKEIIGSYYQIWIQSSVQGNCIAKLSGAHRSIIYMDGTPKVGQSTSCAARHGGLLAY